MQKENRTVLVHMDCDNFNTWFDKQKEGIDRNRFAQVPTEDNNDDLIDGLILFSG